VVSIIALALEMKNENTLSRPDTVPVSCSSISRYGIAIVSCTVLLTGLRCGLEEAYPYKPDKNRQSKSGYILDRG
jgi:hypothetical protein